MLDSITKGYLSLRPAAAAHTLARLDGRDAKALFEAMPRPLAAKVLEHMAPQSAGRCLAQLTAKTAGEILARTPVLAAAAALRIAVRELFPNRCMSGSTARGSLSWPKAEAAAWRVAACLSFKR